MIFTTDSSIDFVRKVTYVFLIGSKTVLYPSSFLFNVVIICHFNTINTLDVVDSGYSRT